ncbi:Glu/Leu/Phe/Val dehydrogenase dimerization domain-containing protein [Anaerosacchariphilus polymeriproducens]|uniref:Glu/Leu/Phe/Val dehydrogenase n=1 Tax=Anaerosacchariphilus polymeriproducens TaxID=1812858 RepID=A0A371AXW1_9FIRM|nr:Glu/Leu/Phe/Val dehydrogenase dimerization domain-containing protein [Anaerosacchariphilus polymeriproducens]RDU24403.1 Glu/Leu/Phe/Val dehydrogenase [Anaerosacchariphilus polymeriproducens]
MIKNEPDIIVSYKDKKEGFNGWLIIDNLDYKLAAGGIRVQKGLTQEHLKLMAQNMTKKMKICGLPISGAKSGIDYDPESPNKEEAISRFVKAIKPFLETRYSMGSDLNTSADELNEIVNKEGLLTIKHAIKNVQNFDSKSFLDRCNVLENNAVGNWKLGKIRAGYQVAMSALKVLEHLNIKKENASVAVQGFGVLARAAIIGLIQHGVNISAVSDIDKSIIAKEGNALPIEEWLNHPGTKLPDVNSTSEYDVVDCKEILNQKVDIMLLAAIENSITVENADHIDVKAVVPGANLAVSEEAEKILYKRDIVVLPSFVAGAGGPMSMNGLYGPKDCPTPQEVLDYIKMKSYEVVEMILLKSKTEDITPSEAAERIVDETNIMEADVPYTVSL